MQKRIDRKLARYAFDSLAEVARYLDTAPAMWRTRHSVSNRPRDSWDLSAGYDGAVTMAREGWLEGARKAQEELRAFVPATPAVALRTDFYGHMPHVPRYCAGAPDSMIRHHKEPTIGSGRILALYVPVNAMATVDARYMRNFGLGVVQYINQLETQGLRVELYAMSVAKDMERHNVLSHTIRLKGADQPLDLAVIAFAIGHPAMARRITFALRERSEVQTMIGYGSTVTATPKHIIEPGNGVVILNGMRNANEHARTPEAALAYITKEIDAAIEQREGVL